VHALAYRQLKGLRLRNALRAWQGVVTVKRRLLQQRRIAEQRVTLLRKRACFKAMLVRAGLS
jgi:hypothetical protein